MSALEDYIAEHPHSCNIYNTNNKKCTCGLTKARYEYFILFSDNEFLRSENERLRRNIEALLRLKGCVKEIE